MPTDEILTLEIEPPYIGSAVSPTVDIDETTDDITVTITDFRGEHSYTVEKTDQAIEDAEQAAQNANNTAQTVAQGWTSKLAEINGTLAQQREQMGSAATAELQRVTAENLRVNAENARVQEWNELSTNVTTATSSANEAAGQANTAAQGAIGAANAANDATTRANNTITGITQTANQIFAQAGQATIDANAAAQSANTAATNANTKAGLADTAAQNADTATMAANNAAQTATTAAEQADSAREAIQDDLGAKADKDGYYQQLTAGLADTVAGGSSEVVQFAQRVSERDGMVRVESLRGNTVRFNQIWPLNIPNKTASGITFTNNNDGTYTINGTATADFISNSVENVDVVAGHKYAVIGNIGTSVFANVYQSGLGGKNAPNVFTSQGDKCIARIYVPNGTTVNNVVIKPMFIDLTTMFGAGNEPATVEEFEALFPEPYYPYDPGSLLSVNVEGMKAVGFNQWDEEWETGSLSGNSGNNSTRDDSIRSKNYIPVLPNTEYCIADASEPMRWIICAYDADKNYITYLRWGGSSADSTLFTTTADMSYIRFTTASYGYGGTYNHDICINISDPDRNGEYEPYAESTREFDLSGHFPTGLKSAGMVYDELDFENRKAVTRIGAVDLGSLTWVAGDTNKSGVYRLYTDGIKTLVKGVADSAIANTTCVPYIAASANYTYTRQNKTLAIVTSGRVWVYDDNYNESTSAAAFKEAMSGVMLYYELATPTETTIPETLQATYPVEMGGTESIVIPTGEQSAPPTMAIVYGYTADGMRDETQSIVAPVERGVASSNYSVGSYLVMSGTLYRVTTAIATGETINPGTNCVATTVMAEILALTA